MKMASSWAQIERSFFGVPLGADNLDAYYFLNSSGINAKMTSANFTDYYLVIDNPTFMSQQWDLCVFSSYRNNKIYKVEFISNYYDEKQVNSKFKAIKQYVQVLYNESETYPYKIRKNAIETYFVADKKTVFVLEKFYNDLKGTYALSVIFANKKTFKRIKKLPKL